MSSLLNRLVTEEHGAVAVIVAIAFPVFILAAVLAVDVSHWNVVKRELQTQADAGALAGGAAWQFPCSSAIESTILSNAQQYAGDATYAGTPENHSFKDLPDSDHHVLYNSPVFYPNRSKSDPGAPALTGHPCADNAIDVKVTQTDVPAFFGINFFARHIDASARAQLKEAAGITGLMPLAVPDPSTVQKAWAQFYDEASGANVGSPIPLLPNGSSNNMALYSTAATTVNVTTDKLGVRAIISGVNDSDCTHNGVECYDQTSTSSTLVSVRRWPTTDPDAAATQPQPWISDLRLGPDNGASACSALYFANVPLSQASCTMKVFATVHFSTKSTTGVTNLALQDVSATVGGGSPVPLAKPADTNPASSSNVWSGTISVPVSSGSSQLSLTLDQHEGSVHGTGCKPKNGNNSACTVTVPDAQRVYGASPLTSGPLGLVQVDEVDSSGQLSTYANSIPKCTTSPCNHNFIVTIGISTLHVATATEQPTVLRLLFNQQNSSQNQSLVCDPTDRNLVDELTNGCKGDFRIAEPNECDGVQHQTDLPQPWPCVEIKGGEQPNAVSQAMKARILGGQASCTTQNANHWSSFPNLPPNDIRIVPLFLTSFGAFEGSGKTTVPIVSFAEFYITGWTTQGSGQPTGCNNDPVPTDTKGGYLVGHFIKRVIPNSDGDNGQDCIPTDLSPCTAVLTK